MRKPELTDDDTLLAALSAVIAAMDPVPSGARRAAVAACGLWNADNELAALVADSTAGELVLLRDDSDSLLLTFRSMRLTVEVEIDGDGQAIGLISPPGRTDIELEVASSSSLPSEARVRSDDLGRFHIHLGRGRRRLRIGSGPDAIVTSWFYC